LKSLGGLATVIRVTQDRSLTQQISSAFALIGGLVALVFVATSVSYAVGWAWITPEVERSRLAGKAGSAALAAMLDQDDALRGYLLTRNARFLDAYHRGRAGLARANEDLVASTATVPEFAAITLRMRIAEENWRVRWAKVAADTPPAGVGPSSAESTELFDAYRTEQAAFADAIDHRTDILTGRERRAAEGGAALTVAVCMTVLFLGVRQRRALGDAIVSPVEGLLRDIGRVRDGELPDIIVDHTCPYELCQLGQGLNEMVHALAAARANAESRDELVHWHSGRLLQVLDASREFSESLNLSYVVRAVRASTAAVGGYEQVIVWLMDDERKRLFNADEGDGVEESAAAVSPDAMVEIGTGLAGRAVKSGRTTFERPQGQLRFIDSDREPIRAIAIPLVVGARVVGALEARHTEPQVPTSQGVEVLEMLAMHAATAIESARLHQLTERRSQMDALTRLFNRRRLEEDLDAECKRCVRYARPLSFVMLDVDHFKAFNDSHGHPQADVALQEVAVVIATGVRTTDTAYRYGGEEFSILLRETSAQDAMHFAERLRHRIEERFATGTLAGITASFGVAQFSAGVQTPRALVEAADAALYDSKRAGRNRVMLSTPPPAYPGMQPGDELESHLS
jgi:diguanylate cyclase (GGDEF)-like protein